MAKRVDDGPRLSELKLCEIVGVSRTAGTTYGNFFDGNTYHVQSLTAKWFSWFTGTSNTKVSWTVWRSTYLQDSGGVLAVS